MSDLEDPSRPGVPSGGERRVSERREGDRRQDTDTDAAASEPPDELPEEDTSGVEPSS